MKFWSDSVLEFTAVSGLLVSFAIIVKEIYRPRVKICQNCGLKVKISSPNYTKKIWFCSKACHSLKSIRNREGKEEVG